MPNINRVTFADSEKASDDGEINNFVDRAIASESLSDTKSTVPGKETRFKDKHSLDSDEEDNISERYNVLHEDDIEGQEDTAVDIQDGITFTPFNMKEELEEGHFDNQGTYIFSKDKNEIQDNWIENIDWVRVKETSQAAHAADSDSDDEPMSPPDPVTIYRGMLMLMKTGESVTKALRRLGGTGGRQRWKVKRAKTDAGPPPDKKGLLKLTELANELVQAGNLDIYQYTFEKFTFLVSKADTPATVIPEGTEDDDALDIFAQDLDKGNGGGESSAVAGTSKGITDDEVQWEYCWSADGAKAEIHGPHSSTEMLQWSEQKFFEAGIHVRKVGSGGEFYSSDRIDFDIYT